MFILLRDVCTFISNANKDDLIGILNMAQTRLLEIEQAELKEKSKRDLAKKELGLEGIENEI